MRRHNMQCCKRYEKSKICSPSRNTRNNIINLFVLVDLFVFVSRQTDLPTTLSVSYSLKVKSYAYIWEINFKAFCISKLMLLKIMLLKMCSYFYHQCENWRVFSRAISIGYNGIRGHASIEALHWVPWDWIDRTKYSLQFTSQGPIHCHFNQ